MRRSMSGHQSPKMKTDVWLTPKSITDRIGSFDLDPCSIDDHPWQIARYWWTESNNGMAKSWRGRVWLNPPFGRQADKWVERLAEHGNGIALLAARTETIAWFRNVWTKAHAVLFLKGRPHFHRRDGTRASFNSGAPIALIAYGSPNAEILKQSGLDGAFIALKA